MKLIDLLVRELPKRGGWPDGAGHIATNGYWRVFAYWVGSTLKGRDLDIVSDAEGYVTRAQYEAALAASKPQWDGNGLPPVGCECEVKVGGDYFNLCRVVYSDKPCGVAFIYLGGDDEKYCGQIDCVSAKASSDYFRPIRSEADKSISNNVLGKLVDGYDIDHWSSLAKERFHKVNELESELIEVRKMLTSFYRSLKEGMMHHKIVTDEE